MKGKKIKFFLSFHKYQIESRTPSRKKSLVLVHQMDFIGISKRRQDYLSNQIRRMGPNRIGYLPSGSGGREGTAQHPIFRHFLFQRFVGSLHFN